MNFLFNLNPLINALIVIIVTVILFRLCYLFEGFSKFKFSDLITIFVLMFIGVFIFFKTLYGIYHVNILKEDYGLAEAKITFYKSGKGRRNIGEVEFEYTVKNQLIANRMSENDFVEIPDNKPDTTITYLVIYENKLPENSFLLFNYPIKENEDLFEYQKLFEKGIPDNVFAN